MSNFPLRIAYAIQNVGGIDFFHDIGDTVPVKQTLLGLQRLGHQVTCLQLSHRSVLAIEDVSNPQDYRETRSGLTGSQVFKVFESATRRLQGSLKLPYFAFFDAFRFYEALIRTLPDYSLCHEHNGLFCVGAALACRRLNMPYVLTFSADPLFERALGGNALHGLHGLVAAREARFTYQIADRILCVSEPARKHLIKSWQVDPEKIVVMPNGVDIDLFNPDLDPTPTRQALGLNGHPVVSFVGGFQHWHGIDRLIESFALVLQEFPAARLLLVGDGRARPAVDQKVAELGLGDQTIITGFVPQSRVPEMLSVADVTVLPYPQLPKELWFSPLKLYEYMAAGKAIVASRAGQIAEVIQDGHTGMLVEPGDVDDLAAKIKSILRDNDTRHRLGTNARRQAVERHSWSQYVAKVEAVYHTVLESHAHA